MQTWEAGLISLLTRSAWTVQPGAPVGTVAANLSHFPEYLAFVERVRVAESPKGDAWLIASDDFCNPSGSGWNFLEEQLSIPAAEGDRQWIADIRAFWNEHLPIAISTRGDYAYLALDRSGRVVMGVAPELEETWEVAKSLDDLSGVLERQWASGTGEIYSTWLAQSDR